MKKYSDKYERRYDRAALRSAMVSLFWVIISERKKRLSGFTFQSLAKAVGSTKHEISRWFNGDPNWTLNTVANLAHALNVDIRVQAVDRITGEVYTPSGIQVASAFSRTTSTKVNGITATDPPVKTTVTRGSSPPPETYASLAA